MTELMTWLRDIGWGNRYLIAYPVALTALLVLMKGRRVRFLFPAMILTVLIVNPLFYRLWEKLDLYAWWRLFWMVPVIPVCAALPAAFSERIQEAWPKRGWLRLLAVCGCLAIYGLSGTWMYGEWYAGFSVPAENSVKLPGYVVEVAEELLRMKEHPRIISDESVSTYIRQYTGEIDTIYGRDLKGYIYPPDQTAREVYTVLCDPEADLEPVRAEMLNEPYDYLVLWEETQDARVTANGFQKVGSAGGYGIYTTTGTPTLRKERNAIGQVVSVTLLDESGAARNGPEGWATVTYAYDGYGNITREFHLDAEGEPVTDEAGQAGVERKWNLSGQWVTECCLGADGKPVTGRNGYAKAERTYDRPGNLVSETFFGPEGNPVVAAAGYARMTMEYNREGKLIREAWFGADGKNMTLPAGYAAIEQEYNKDGELFRRKYLNGEGKAVTRTDGYTEAVWETAGKVRNIRFLDAAGKTVETQGLNLAMDVRTGEDGWSPWMTPAAGKTNQIFTIGTVNLGEKAKGDRYTCQMEIEFRGVTPAEKGTFGFQTRGSTDGDWSGGNPWNGLLKLTEAPADGIMNVQRVRKISAKMVGGSTFRLSFRCDNWGSGSFRVRQIKIEKGDTATPWTPGV